ncbi:hypothetical protein ASPWEDRAFT_57408 [Aspergillus wentii DTO 134E9]|uniref:Uncharacterized protein n=1 Tax=Aspergillus wentii DTO 134E9 TaxID=1073089 RepID=A0A1L9RV58_ASPWE|nr:uncharacterized protein ASPWEDRAFT_57408 [Aspergillus wentii DTO 134E9]OJJ38805.1 hypothetical protein ASPWEDRAFT_57408 [Aspergillus wentii DTO 134E9]
MKRSRSCPPLHLSPKRVQTTAVSPSSTRSLQRSRSSSPSRPSEAQYRQGPLRRANIRVDDEIPMEISLYTDSNVFHTLDNNIDLYKISEKLWSKSKELVKKPSGEAKWTEALYTVINELKPPGLKITTTNSLSPHPHASHAIEAAIPVFKLKDPRPDICVGLSNKNLATALEPKKDTSSLISDPYITPLGLRFPFLIVEAKAVGGSTALQIFKNLSDLNDVQDLDEVIQEIIEDSPGSAQGLSDSIVHLAFSVMTEGPIHELWLHFQRAKEEDFSMVCLGTWRTTLRDGSLNFLRHLLAVSRWGNGALKNGIVSILEGL